VLHFLDMASDDWGRTCRVLALVCIPLLVLGVSVFIARGGTPIDLGPSLGRVGSRELYAIYAGGSVALTLSVGWVRRRGGRLRKKLRQEWLEELEAGEPEGKSNKRVDEKQKTGKASAPTLAGTRSKSVE